MRATNEANAHLVTKSLVTKPLVTNLPAAKAIARPRPAPLALLALAAAALALAAAPRPAAAADGFDHDFMKNTLQMLGLADEEKPEIDYRERAPLVVPPAAAAAAPESGAVALPAPAASPSSTNPNWPKDPDVARRRREAEASRAPIIREENGRPLLPSELNKGRRRGASTPDAPVGADSKRDVLLPSELGFTKWFGLGGNEKPLTFEGEPTRESLIQPPEGYQTPAPNAPYGVVEPKKEPFKLPTLFDRQ